MSDNHLSLQLLRCSPCDLCFLRKRLQVRLLQVVFLINHIILEGFHFQNGNIVRPMQPKEAFSPLGLTNGPIVKKMTVQCVILASQQNRKRSFCGLLMLIQYQQLEVATKKFPIHEATICHKEACLKVILLPSTTPDIASSLSLQHQVACKERQQCFLKILSNMRF